MPHLSQEHTICFCHRLLISQRLITSLRECWLDYMSHLAQLHEDVDDAQEIARAERIAHIRGDHVVLVQCALALAQAAADDVLMLPWQALLNIALQASKQKGPQHAVQPLHQRLQQRMALTVEMKQLSQGCTVPCPAQTTAVAQA